MTISLRVTTVRRDVDRIVVFAERSDDGQAESFFFMPDTSEEDIRTRLAARASELNAVQTKVDELSANLVGQEFPQ